MLTPAAVYDLVGGFTTLLPGNYNDVDYCMKLRHAGYDIVYEPVRRCTTSSLVHGSPASPPKRSN